MRVLKQYPELCSHPVEPMRSYSLSEDSSCSYEPRHEKTCLQGLRPGKTQTGLLSYKS